MTAAQTHLRPPRPHLQHVSLCFTSVSSSLIAWLVCCPDPGAQEDHQLGLSHNRGSDTRYAAAMGYRSCTRGLRTRVLRAGTEVCKCTAREGHTLRSACLQSASARQPRLSSLKAWLPMTSPPRAESGPIPPPAAHAGVGDTHRLQAEVRARVAGKARFPG